MDKSRRNFLKLLPLAPVAAFTVTVEGQEGKMFRADITGQYIFHFPSRDVNQHNLVQLKARLEEMGYKNPLVLGGAATEGFALYEVHSHPATHSTHDEPHADCYECIVRAIERAKREKRI